MTGGANEVFAGASIFYRVIGTFEDGSERDITALDRVAFSLLPNAATEASIVTSGNDKGRVTGNRRTTNNLTVRAADTLNEFQPVTASLRVVGGTPQSIELLLSRNGELTVPPFQPVPSGVPQQFRARVTFEEAGVPQLIVPLNDPRLVWDVEPVAGTTAMGDTGDITPRGVFTGTNNRAETGNPDNTEYDVTATFRPDPDNEAAAPFDPIMQTESIPVAAATYIEGTLELRPPQSVLVIGGTETFTAFGTFQVGEDQVLTADITQALDSLTIDSTAVANFDDSGNAIDNVLRGLAATPADLAATVTATFRGDTDSSSVIVVAPDFDEIKLVPVGVAPFEAAGVFNQRPPLSNEDADALRETVANDALLLGLTRDGRVPTCSNPEGCPGGPDGQLAEHQTVPAVSIAYAVVARLQGDPAFGEMDTRGILLREFQITCADNTLLPVTISDSNEFVDIATGHTASGIQIAFVEGKTEGLGNIRARLGRDVNNDAFDSGINCNFVLDTPGEELVQDADQDIVVGVEAAPMNEVAAASLAQTKTDPVLDPVESTSFNLNKQFACVGFANAANALDPTQVRGRDKILSSLGFVTMSGNAFTVNMNQQRNVQFRAESGPAASREPRACRNDADAPELESAPSIRITNAANEERGVTSARTVLAVDTNCAAADFDPVQDPPGFIEPRNQGATYLVLPVDDEILRGDSALGNDIQSVCQPLAPLVTLPIGNFVGLPNGEGLVLELVNIVGSILSAIANNEQIEPVLGDDLEEVLNEITMALGGVIDTTGLNALLDPIVGLLGLNDQSPVDGSALPTLADGLTLLLEELRAQLDEAPRPPMLVDPGDLFEDPLDALPANELPEQE